MENAEEIKNIRISVGPEPPIRTFIAEHYKILTQSEFASNTFASQLKDHIAKCDFTEVFNICVSNGYLTFDSAIEFSFLLFNLTELFGGSFDIGMTYKIIQGYFNFATDDFLNESFAIEEEEEDEEDEDED